MGDKKITINISSGTFIKAILFVSLLVLLYYIRDIVLVVLFSVVIASGVEPVARWFQKKKIPRIPAVILIYLLAFLILGSIFYMVIPTMFDEFSSFSGELESYLARPYEPSILNEFLSIFPASVSDLFRDFAMKTSEYVEVFTTGFLGSAAKIFGGALSFILMIVFSFYLSVQEKGIENFLRVIIPIKQEEYVLDLWFRARHKIGLWLQGQLLLGLIVAILCFLGLTILGVNYALTFALLAGIFEIIPVFGPILSAIPPIVAGLAISPMLALKIVILYIIVQQFENHLIYPLVVRKIIGIPPVLTILALVIGGKLGGVFGVLLAMPAVTVLVEVLNDIDKKKHQMSAI